MAKLTEEILWEHLDVLYKDLEALITGPAFKVPGPPAASGGDLRELKGRVEALNGLVEQHSGLLEVLLERVKGLDCDLLEAFERVTALEHRVDSLEKAPKGNFAHFQGDLEQQGLMLQRLEARLDAIEHPL